MDPPNLLELHPQALRGCDPVRLLAGVALPFPRDAGTPSRCSSGAAYSTRTGKEPSARAVTTSMPEAPGGFCLFVDHLDVVSRKPATVRPSHSASAPRFSTR